MKGYRNKIDIYIYIYIYMYTDKLYIYIYIYTHTYTHFLQDTHLREEQDGRGVGGHGVHLSPQIHQEHTFRHRSACRTPAEIGQEYLTSGREYIEPCNTR